MTEIEAAEAACRAAWVDYPYDPAKPQGAWHLHHEMLFEFLTEPAEKRIDYILSAKPKAEQELRLARFRPVRGPIPEPLVKAGAAYDKAGAAYDKAGAAYDKAGAAFAKAWAAYDADITALHAAECGCEWTGSIFR